MPFNYHYAGMFYNTKVLADAGMTKMPATWDEFLALCKTLKEKGIAPIALGSKNRWPAQFWFDYLLLRTAGPDYRAKLMSGEAKYTDPEVAEAMAMWKELFDAGYFVENANADDWTDAADKVTRGEAGMTLMGTWITGYWNGNGLKPGEDYDFFEFPKIKDGVPNAAVGPVEVWWSRPMRPIRKVRRSSWPSWYPTLMCRPLGPMPKAPLGQRQRRSEELQCRDAEGGHNRGRRRGLCLQLRPCHAASGGRGRPVDVHPLHRRTFKSG